jgi:hypothetical protein
MIGYLLRVLGLRALERRAFGRRGPREAGRGGFGRFGLPTGGLPMVAYLAWVNRARIASALRWARGQLGPRGGMTPGARGAHA